MARKLDAGGCSLPRRLVAGTRHRAQRPLATALAVFRQTFRAARQAGSLE